MARRYYCRHHAIERRRVDKINNPHRSHRRENWHETRSPEVLAANNIRQSPSRHPVSLMVPLSEDVTAVVQTAEKHETAERRCKNPELTSRMPTVDHCTARVAIQNGRSIRKSLLRMVQTATRKVRCDEGVKAPPRRECNHLNPLSDAASSRARCDRTRPPWAMRLGPRFSEL